MLTLLVEAVTDDSKVYVVINNFLGGDVEANLTCALPMSILGKKKNHLNQFDVWNI